MDLTEETNPLRAYTLPPELLNIADIMGILLSTAVIMGILLSTAVIMEKPLDTTVIMGKLLNSTVIMGKLLNSTVIMGQLVNTTVLMGMLLIIADIMTIHPMATKSKRIQTVAPSKVGTSEATKTIEADLLPVKDAFSSRKVWILLWKMVYTK
jgi:hypothetical protein